VAAERPNALFTVRTRIGESPQGHVVLEFNSALRIISNLRIARGSVPGLSNVGVKSLRGHRSGNAASGLKRITAIQSASIWSAHDQSTAFFLRLHFSEISPRANGTLRLDRITGATPLLSLPWCANTATNRARSQSGPIVSALSFDHALPLSLLDARSDRSSTGNPTPMGVWLMKHVISSGLDQSTEYCSDITG